jgi:hypothetical protein
VYIHNGGSSVKWIVRGFQARSEVVWNFAATFGGAAVLKRISGCGWRCSIQRSAAECFANGIGGRLFSPFACFEIARILINWTFNTRKNWKKKNLTSHESERLA